jgi:hypothetical protein
MLMVLVATTAACGGDDAADDTTVTTSGDTTATTDDTDDTTATTAATDDTVATTEATTVASDTFIVVIDDGVFQPPMAVLDPIEQQKVRWINRDGREIVIESDDGLFASPTLAEGDEWEFDFSTLEPGMYRYHFTDFNEQVPGIIDTRLER